MWSCLSLSISISNLSWVMSPRQTKLCSHSPLHWPTPSDLKLIDISRDNGPVFAVTLDSEREEKYFIPKFLYCTYLILINISHWGGVFFSSHTVYLLTLRVNNLHYGNGTSDRNLKTIFFQLLPFHCSSILGIYEMKFNIR